MSKAPTIYVENKDGDVLEVDAIPRDIPRYPTAHTWYDEGYNSFVPDELPFMNYPSELLTNTFIHGLEDWYAGWYDAATEYEFSITGEC